MEGSFNVQPHRLPGPARWKLKVLPVPAGISWKIGPEYEFTNSDTLMRCDSIEDASGISQLIVEGVGTVIRVMGSKGVGNILGFHAHPFRVRWAEFLVNQHVVRCVNEIPRGVIISFGRLWWVAGHPVALASRWRGSNGSDDARRVELALGHLARVSTQSARASSPWMQLIIVLFVALGRGGIPVPRLAIRVVSAQLAALLDCLRLLEVYASGSVVHSLFIFWTGRLALLLCRW